MSDAIDTAYDLLADAINEVASFLDNSDEWLDSHRLPRNDRQREITERTLVSARAAALCRLQLQLRERP